MITAKVPSRWRAPAWTAALWVVLVALHAWYYVTSILALPDIPGGYEASWDFQLLMFALVRLPLWVLALGVALSLFRFRRAGDAV
jgi:hypothetical protein